MGGRGEMEALGGIWGAEGEMGVGREMVVMLWGTVGFCGVP